MSDSTIVTPRGWWDLADASLFYPSDLPEDWRLGYFANAFSAVLLPAATWVQADTATLQQWREDVTPRFRFVAEAGRGPKAADQAAELGRILGPQLSDWLSPGLLPVPVQDPSRGPSPDSAPQSGLDAPRPAPPPEPEPDGPVCVGCWPAQANRPGTRSGNGWDSQAARGHEGRTDEYAVLVPAALHQDLRAARRWLDRLITDRSKAPAVILLARPSSDTLESWLHLVELLGLQRGSDPA